MTRGEELRNKYQRDTDYPDQEVDENRTATYSKDDIKDFRETEDDVRGHNPKAQANRESFFKNDLGYTGDFAGKADDEINFENTFNAFLDQGMDSREAFMLALSTAKDPEGMRNALRTKAAEKIK